MKKTLIKVGTVVTMDGSFRTLREGGIIINGSMIEKVLDRQELSDLSFQGDILDATNLVAIPGFIQTHIHLCQTLFRGLADDLELLDWLRLKIFPFEAAHSERSMYFSSLIGLAELIRSGTTTILDMGSVHHEEEVIRAVMDSGIRAFVGKAMMDINDMYPLLKESTKESVTSTVKQAEQWHNADNGRIRYAVAPRFILSCTDTLLSDAYQITTSFPGMLFHTHAAENRNERACFPHLKVGASNIVNPAKAGCNHGSSRSPRHALITAPRR